MGTKPFLTFKNSVIPQSKGQKRSSALQENPTHRGFILHFSVTDDWLQLRSHP